MFIIKQREDENFKPVLARIDGDPPGTPGISIFVVPKHYVNPDSYICEPKDFTTTGIEHKMGIKGCGHLLAVTHAKKENSGRGFRQEGRFYLRANYQTSRCSQNAAVDEIAGRSYYDLYLSLCLNLTNKILRNNCKIMKISS